MAGGLGERAHEQNELPALILRQATFERGHGSAPLGDLVEDFAIGDGCHALRVGEVCGKRTMCPRLGAVAFAMFPVTLGTFICIDLPGGAQDGLRGKQRIPETFVFRRNDPRFVLLVEPVDDQNANEKEKSGEKEFTEFEGERGGGGHGNKKNSRTSG